MNYIRAEVVNRIDGKTVLTNEHLMNINNEQDEELFFEAWPASNDQKSNITPHVSKKNALLHN